MAIAVMGDDESASSLILRLSRLGFDAIHAKRGSRAFARVLEASDVIVCDSTQHAEIGIEATGRLPGAFVLMTPKLPSAEEMVDAMRLGVIDVVTMSVDDVEFGARMRAALNRAKPTDLRIAGQLDSLERDQRAGHYVQLRMLPSSPTTIDRYRLAHRVQPSMILSGDFVDYFRLTDSHFVFYIADVSGHGASSAFVTVILKTFTRRLRREYRPHMLQDPGEILALLNRELLDQGLGKHVTMFIGVVDIAANNAALANAGHFPHPIYAAAKESTYIEAPGKPVGLFDDVAYDVTNIALEPGDSVVAFSDGVFEVMHEEELAAKEERLLRCTDANAPDIAALWRALGVVEGSPAPDDITCLTVTREA